MIEAPLLVEPESRGTRCCNRFVDDRNRPILINRSRWRFERNLPWPTVGAGTQPANLTHVYKTAPDATDAEQLNHTICNVALRDTIKREPHSAPIESNFVGVEVHLFPPDQP